MGILGAVVKFSLPSLCPRHEVHSDTLAYQIFLRAFAFSGLSGRTTRRKVCHRQLLIYSIKDIHKRNGQCIDRVLWDNERCRRSRQFPGSFFSLYSIKDIHKQKIRHHILATPFHARHHLFASADTSPAGRSSAAGPLLPTLPALWTLAAEFDTEGSGRFRCVPGLSPAARPADTSLSCSSHSSSMLRIISCTGTAVVRLIILYAKRVRRKIGCESAVREWSY